MHPISEYRGWCPLAVAEQDGGGVGIPGQIDRAHGEVLAGREASAIGGSDRGGNSGDAAQRLSLRIVHATLGAVAAFILSFLIVFAIHACGPWW